MLCEQCGKKEAEVHVVNVVDGERRISHLCRDCAGSRLRMEEVTNIIKMQFSIDGLTNIEEAFRDLVIPALKQNRSKQAPRHVCPHCGGVLPEEMFRTKDDALFEDNADAAEDMSPEETAKMLDQLFVMSAEEEMAGLAKKMQEAVANENYETAAVLRDRIHELKHTSSQEKHI